MGERCTVVFERSASFLPHFCSAFRGCPRECVLLYLIFLGHVQSGIWFASRQARRGQRHAGGWARVVKVQASFGEVSGAGLQSREAWATTCQRVRFCVLGMARLW